MDFFHTPVLAREIVEAFDRVFLKIFVDGTVGAGGHASLLLAAHPEIEQYIAIDRDPLALNLAKERLQPFTQKITFHHGNFASFELPPLQGALLDLGLSTMQLHSDRGFSFQREEDPLDMRMDSRLDRTAADIVNEESEEALGHIFLTYGEERRWRLAARAIVRARAKRALQTVGDLIAACDFYRKGRRHPMTQIFQALRIAVNGELDNLSAFLERAFLALEQNGRLAIISFHSLEDRIVKYFFKEKAEQKLVRLLTKKPIQPTLQELHCNPKSRSAKLRVLEKI